MASHKLRAAAGAGHAGGLAAPASGATSKSFAWINASAGKRPYHYYRINRLSALACYASGQGKARLERLGPARIEVRLEKPLRAGRARINCTMPGNAGRWRWYGTQFYVARPRG